MMNKETRRLAKIPDEVREEIGHHFVDSPPVVSEDNRKLPKLDGNRADYIRNGLTVSSLLSLSRLLHLLKGMFGDEKSRTKSPL